MPVSDRLSEGAEYGKSTRLLRSEDGVAPPGETEARGRGSRQVEESTHRGGLPNEEHRWVGSEQGRVGRAGNGGAHSSQEFTSRHPQMAVHQLRQQILCRPQGSCRSHCAGGHALMMDTGSFGRFVSLAQRCCSPPGTAPRPRPAVSCLTPLAAARRHQLCHLVARHPRVRDSSPRLPPHASPLIGERVAPRSCQHTLHRFSRSLTASHPDGQDRNQSFKYGAAVNN